MELWIRNQDKTRLTMVNDLYLVHDENNACDYIGNNMVGHLAKYTTPGRALEILHEIEKLIKPIIKINYEYDDSQPIMNGEWLKSLKEENKIEELSIYVYEMPKE